MHENKVWDKKLPGDTQQNNIQLKETCKPSLGYKSKEVSNGITVQELENKELKQFIHTLHEMTGLMLSKWN